MQRLREWLKDGAYEKERTYALVALLVIAGFVLLSRSIPGGVNKSDPVNNRFATVLEAAQLHVELAGSFPSANRLRFLLASDGVSARIARCGQLSRRGNSPLLYVDPASGATRLYVHGYDRGGDLVTLVAAVAGNSVVTAGSCGNPANVQPAPAHHH